MPRVLTGTSADRAAARNWAANLRALARRQEALVRQVEAVTPRVAWLYGRDGALTGREAEGRWLAGCTLPRRAAAEMLRSLAVSGRSACFLAPPHAAHVRMVLEKIGRRRSLIAVVAELRSLRWMLGCEDFSAEIEAGRLWLCGGPRWAEELERIFTVQGGLAVPQQFVRVSMDGEVDFAALAREAEGVIQRAGERRAERQEALKRSWRPGRGRVCCIAGSEFRLWEGAAGVLLETVAGLLEGGDGAGEPRGRPIRALCRFDPDSPLCASPLALLEAAEGCETLISADLGRADVPGLLPEELPWISWAVGRAPDFSAAGPRDRLLAADATIAQAAERAGWPSERVTLAAWPAAAEPSVAQTKPPELALIHDTHDLSVPVEHEHYSSHRLLWESIREQLLADPFVLADPAAYLSQQMRRHGIAEDGFDRGAFIARLVLPAYRQGLALALIRAGIAVGLYGEGWDTLPEFAARAGGAVDTAEAFESAVGSSRGLVAPWPQAIPAELCALGRPVLRGGTSRATFLRDARATLSGEAMTPPRTGGIPSLAQILAAVL